jgi:hypothetical protein
MMYGACIRCYIFITGINCVDATGTLEVLELLKFSEPVESLYLHNLLHFVCIPYCSARTWISSILSFYELLIHIIQRKQIYCFLVKLVQWIISVLEKKVHIHSFRFIFGF